MPTPSDYQPCCGAAGDQHYDGCKQKNFVRPSIGPRPTEPEQPHCATCICGRRAPVRASWELDKGAGTIAWSEYLTIYNRHSARYGGDLRHAEYLAAHGGFSYKELYDLLGHAPTTWAAR